MFKVDEPSRKIFQWLFYGRKRKGVTIDDLIIFTDQMQSMYKAGFTFSATMTFLQEHIDNELMKDALFTIQTELERGIPLSRTLSVYKNIFPEYYINMIGAGEIGGVLEETFKRLSRYLKSEKKLKKEIKKVFFYPKFVFGAIVAGVVILSVVQNKITITRESTIFIIAICIIVLLIRDIIKSFIHTERGQKIWDLFRLKIWFLSPLYIEHLNKQFMELFMSLFNSGLHIVNVFNLIGNTMENKIYSKEIINIGERIEQGVSILESIDGCKFFPYYLKTLFHLGKITGEYDKNFDSYIRQKELEISLKIKKIMEYSYIILLVILIILTLLMRTQFKQFF